MPGQDIAEKVLVNTMESCCPEKLWLITVSSVSKYLLSADKSENGRKI